MKKLTLLVFVWILGFACLPARQGIWNLYGMDVNLLNQPIPGDTEIIWQDRPFELNGRQGNATHLRSYKKIEEIMDFYKDGLAPRGWQLAKDYKELNAALFKKADQFLYVLVIENGLDFPRDVFIASSPQDLAICNELDKLFLEGRLIRDASGKDSLDILRYPGAKRRISMFTADNSETLIYETDALADAVASFYEKTLKSEGWSLGPAFRPAQLKKSGLDLNIENFRILFFEKGEDSVFVHITPLVTDNSKGSMITITKNIYQDADYPQEEVK